MNPSALGMLSASARVLPGSALLPWGDSAAGSRGGAPGLKKVVKGMSVEQRCEDPHGSGLL